MFSIITIAIFAASIYLLHQLLIHPLFLSPLRHVPGPKIYALTKWRLAYEDLRGRRTRTIHNLHLRYGPAIRIGPNEIHFNSLTGLRSIYGAGSTFGRTDFYRMFDVYGHQNLFTFHSGKEHAARKKLLAHAYSKSAIIRGPSADMIYEKIGQFMALLEREPKTASEVFRSLHYYSLDAITAFLYGPDFGGTAAMEGNLADRALLDDILDDPNRRLLTWFATHLPGLTAWLYSLNNYPLLNSIIQPLLPMKPPTTYTAIRKHALRSWQRFHDSKQQTPTSTSSPSLPPEPHPTILSLLHQSHSSTNPPTSQNPIPSPLPSLAIASELADHLLAGISTTADTLTFLLFQLSLPHNRAIQERLVNEVRNLPAEALTSTTTIKTTSGTVNGTTSTAVPTPALATLSSAATLPIFTAILRETLRLHAPLPASEPRVCLEPNGERCVDGWRVPPGTVVAMQPFSLHREASVFGADAEVWRPGRWIDGEGEDAKEGGKERSKRREEMGRWFWAFSSGARGCLGMHLATAEMALVPAIYRKYRTAIKPGWEGVSPGNTSRFEVFHDESFGKVEEHTCWLDFVEE